MAQTTVPNYPNRAYGGMVHVGGQYPSTIISRVVDETNGIPFGFGVALSGTGELTVGSQQVKLPDAATDITTAALFQGVAIADPSLEEVNGAGLYSDEDPVSVMKEGLIWVEVQAAITDISVSVYCGIATAAGGAGSFNGATGTGYSVVPNAKWRGYYTDGTSHFGLLELSL